MPRWPYPRLPRKEETQPAEPSELAKDMRAKADADIGYYKHTPIEQLGIEHAKEVIIERGFQMLGVCELVDRLAAEVERLKKEKEVEKQAAQKVCQIYFEIAEEVISADEIRRRRDQALQQKGNKNGIV